MQCATVKKGIECGFMDKKGCTFVNGHCEPIVEDCVGCAKTTIVEDGTYCTVAPNPGKKWAGGLCNFATHKKIEIVESTQKLNPLKASKRAAGKKK